MRNQRLRVLQLADLYIKGYLPLPAYDALILANRQQLDVEAVAPHPGYKRLVIVDRFTSRKITVNKEEWGMKI